MCGLFGFVADENKMIDPKILRRVATNTMRRGPHSWGIAWVNPQGKLRMFKQTGRIVDDLGLLVSLAKDARMLIGHCRYATHGSPENNLNNHPHPCDGGWVVHNGQIKHYETIIDRFDLHPITECDSEVVGLMIESRKGTLLERVATTVSECRGGTPFSMMGLWKSKFAVARENDQPLHIGEADGGYYLASLASGLVDDCWNVKKLKEGQVTVFNISQYNKTRIPA